MIVKNVIDNTLPALIGLLLLGVATKSDASESAAEKEIYEAAYQAAEETRQQAAAAGFEWRDTAKVLAQSKKRAQAGDFRAAMELVNRAQREAELGVKQAQIEAENWKQRVIQ